MSFVGDVVGGLTGSDKSANTAKSQAEAMLEMQERAQELGEERYGEAVERLDPYLTGGGAAYDQYLAQLGMAPAGVEAIDPTQTAAFQSMMDETRGQLEESAASQGMLHSGQFMQDIGAGTQGVYQNYLNQLAQLGGSGQNVASNLSSLGMGQAATLGSQMMGAQQSAGQMRMQGASAGQQGMGDLMGAVGTGLGMYFSDRRLKAKIKKIGKVGPLNLYRWIWRQFAPFKGESTGFIADEVAQQYPDAVTTGPDGLQRVNYALLFDRLSGENG